MTTIKLDYSCLYNEVRKRHDAMARLLLRVLAHSDTVWKAKRSKRADAHYREALRLVREAGLKYEPPVDKKFADRG